MQLSKWTLVAALAVTGCGQALTASEQADVEKFQAAVAAEVAGGGNRYGYLEANVQQMIDLMRRDPDATYKGRRMIEVLSDDAQLLSELPIETYSDGAKMFGVDERIETAIELEERTN